MSVKVAVRTRPLNGNETKENADIIIRMNENEVSVVESIEGYGGHFIYDRALWSSGVRIEDSANSEATQEYVYNAIGAEMLDHFVTGYNGCIFAYGQTGSGKTYCMMGSSEDPGIVPRIAENLFARAAELRQQHIEVCVEVSYYEIYNEKVRCLLRPTSGGYDDTPLRVREHPKFGPFIEGLAKFVVSSQSEFLQLMSDGNKVRTTASTAMNATSSRSHAVFTIALTQKQKKGTLQIVTSSKLNLVDLAGSERASKTMATGKRLAEGANINKSLTCLGNVISALAEMEETGKPRHIPYRDSTLTWILKDNLGGNSKTVMLATISPSSAQYEETMSTLRYAERAKKIMNKAVVNETNNNELIAALQKEITALKGQLQNASEAERIKLQEELDASEAVKKELTASLEEKLAGTRKLMEEREQYMKHLEVKLTAQNEEIENLKSANAEKERKIEELLQKIQSMATTADNPQVEQIREQVAALEQEQSAVAGRLKSKQQAHDNAPEMEDSLVYMEDGETENPNHFTNRAKPEVVDISNCAARSVIPAAVREGMRQQNEHAFSAALAEPDTRAQPSLPAPEQEDDEVLIHDDELDLSGMADSDLEDLLSDPKKEDSDLLADSDIDLDSSLSIAGIDEEKAATPPTQDSAPYSHKEATVASIAADPVATANLPSVGTTGASTVERSSAGIVTSTTTSSFAPVAKPIPPPHGSLPAPPQAVECHTAPPPTHHADPAPAASETEMRLQVQNFFTQSSEQPAIYPANSNITRLIIPSDALPNNRFLHEAFHVIKMKETAMGGHRKDRVWEIDFFRSVFTNNDTAGVKSFELSAANLFRVEKDGQRSRRLTVHFFDAPHPYELEFTSTRRRQQFYELATLLRRNSIMWCPSLCMDSESDVAISVRGTTIRRPHASSVPVNGKAKMAVARMPYEVIDVWVGCISLEGKSLPRNSALFSGFFPTESHEVYVIGVMNVPSSQMGSDSLARYFLAYLGTSSHFILINSTASSKKHQTNNAVIVLCKRSFIVRVANIEHLDTVAVKKDGIRKGDFTAAGCALRINEASIGVILLNAKNGEYSPQTRTVCIRTLLSSFPFGNESVDMSVRFDYFIVAGRFAYGQDFVDGDELIKSILSNSLMSSMRETEPSAALKASPQPLRIFYYVKPNVCRMDVLNYSSSRALGLPNVYMSADIFCQRPFLSIFGESTPPAQLVLDRIFVSADRFPVVGDAELHISCDVVDESPVVVKLAKRGDDYAVPPSATSSLNICVSNPEFIRLQTLTFSVLGTVGSAGSSKRIVVASGVFPMKAVKLASPALLHVPLYYRGCTVGKLTGALLYLYHEKTNTEIESLGFHGVKFAALVSCYENEVRRQDGTWAAATLDCDGVHNFSTKDPRQQQSREEVSLPDDVQWRWLSAWQHDSRDDDKEGWAYATAVGAELQLNADSTTLIRRRRWVRVMQAQDPLSFHTYIADRMERSKETDE